MSTDARARRRRNRALSAMAPAALLALVTLVLKSILEWRFGAELAAARRH